jgi:hypothetical protein
VQKQSYKISHDHIVWSHLLPCPFQSLSMSTITNNSLSCPYMSPHDSCSRLAPLPPTHSDTHPPALALLALLPLHRPPTGHSLSLSAPASPRDHLPPPPMGNPPELYYKILDLPRDTSPSEIRAAYMKLVKKWHPDKHPPSSKPEAEARFKAITEAYEVSKFLHRRRCA